MKPSDNRPISLEGVSENTIVAEVIITPEITSFLLEAQNKKCIIHKGKPMLEGQIKLMLDFIRK